MPDDAVAQARDELAAAASVFGPEHPYTIKIRTKLAKALGAAGAAEEELPVRRRILADLTAHTGAQNTDTAVAAHNYGFCLYECGRPQEAVGYIERAIRDIAPFVRQDGSALFRLRRNLAVVLQAAGRTAEAIAMLERILAQQAENTTVTPDDLRTARIALAEDYGVRTGAAARRQGRARGEQLWLAVLRSEENDSGPDDVEVVRLRGRLADFYSAVGRHREALQLYRRNLEDRERVFGPEHRLTMLSRADLAICHEVLGEQDAAARLFAPLLEQRSRLLGADHADTLDTLDSYALCLFRLHRYAEAGEAFATLVDARTRLGGVDDPARARYLSWVGWSRYHAGEPDRGLGALRACLTDRERILGVDDRSTMQTRHAVGAALLALHRYEAAIPVFERALAERERILGAGKSSTVRTRSMLALALASDGRHDESVARRSENYQALAGACGAEDQESILALRRLADAEEEAKQYPDALASYARALAMAERVFGPEHPDTVLCRVAVAARQLSKGSPDEAIPLFEQVLANYRRNFGAEDERTLRIRRDLARCHDGAGRVAQALEEYRVLLIDAERVLPTGSELRRSLAADLAEPPVPSWWNRETLTGRRLWQVALGTVEVAEALDAGCTADILYKRRWLAPSDTAAARRASRSGSGRDELLRLLRGLARPAPGVPAGGPVSAWRIARYVDNVRDGVVAGHLDEPEAWELLEQITEPTAQTYDSWRGFTADYLAGRSKRLGLSGPSRRRTPTRHRRRVEAVERLLDPRNTDSPFNRAPWGTARNTAHGTARDRNTVRTAEVHG